MSEAVEVCGRRLVLISLDTGPAPNFAVPASLLNEKESLISAVPSARQKTSVSSDSTRLHWGQRFIWGGAATCRRCCPRVSSTQSRDWFFILENSSFATDPYSVDQIAKGPSAARP